jgi:hypothetical protein
MIATHRFGPRASLGAIVFVATGLACASLPTLAPAAEAGFATAAPVFLTMSDDTHLERAFWACDYNVTTYGADRVDAMACSAIYETLKRRKFSGDFNALVDWWQRNKTAEHAREQAAE